MKVRFRTISQIENFVKIAKQYESKITVTDTAETYTADGKSYSELKILGTGKIVNVNFEDKKSSDFVMFESQIEALGIVR